MLDVSFITTQDDDDLIVSFAVADPDYTDVKSLTLLRTPKYEFALYESERGVNVSYDDFPGDDDDMLEKIEIDGDRVEIITRHRSYALDVHRVDEDEVKESKKILKKMNFDRRFKLRLR